MLFNPFHAVYPNNQIIQIFQGVRFDIRQYLLEKFLQKLQVCMKTDSGSLLFPFFIILQIRNNLDSDAPGWHCPH